MAKKLSQVIGNLLAPYLAKYLPLSGGELSGGLTASNFGYKANQRYCYMYFPYTDDAGNAAIYAWFFKNLSSNRLANARFIIANDGIYTGPDDPVNLGTSNNRWPIIYGKDGDFSGNISAKSINGVSTSSLVSLDDLKDVLTSQQIAKLEAKVAQRIDLAKSDLQSAENQQKMGGV